MAKRRRRRRSTFSKVLLAVLAIGLLAVAAWAVFEFLIPKTAVVTSGSMGNQYRVEAVVVRDETVVDIEGLKRVIYHADEGEVVISGSKIADVYATGYSQGDINKLLNIRTNIKGQIKTLLASEYADAQLDRMDTQILDYARELGLLVRGRQRGNLLNLEDQLTGALKTRQTYLKSKYEKSDQALIDYYREEEALVKKIQNWTHNYVATQNWIVSFYTDNYEKFLTVSGVDAITLDQAKLVLAGGEPPMTSSQRGRTAVYRQVNPGSWYILAIVNDKDWSPTDGQTYRIHLDGFDGNIVDGVVSSHTRVGNEVLVRLRVDSDVTPFLNVRTSTGTVGESRGSGLKVPESAIYRQNGQDGVVAEGYFIPVNVISRDPNVAIVESVSPGALREGQRVRLF